jgi:hypothetical protein
LLLITSRERENVVTYENYTAKRGDGVIRCLKIDLFDRSRKYDVTTCEE